MDRRAWQATVPGVAKSWTLLSDFHLSLETQVVYGEERAREGKATKKNISYMEFNAAVKC